MTGAQFRQAQAQVLDGRVECWSCGFLFDKKELIIRLISVLVGKVATADYTTQALLHRVSIDVDTIDEMPERKNLYEIQPLLICSGCNVDNSQEFKENHFDSTGNWVAHKSPEDLYLD